LLGQSQSKVRMVLQFRKLSKKLSKALNLKIISHPICSILIKAQNFKTSTLKNFEGKITPTDAKNTYNSKNNIKVVDNFVAHMFPQMEVKKHNTIIDAIDFTGIASTIKGCVSYPGADEYNGRAINSGFKTFVHES